MQRLRSAAEIERVRREGRSYAHPLVVLIVAPTETDGTSSRVAVVAGRRIGGAVIRNRAKRLLREATRREALRSGWDLMFVARAAIVGARLDQVQGAVRQVLQRAALVG